MNPDNDAMNRRNFLTNSLVAGSAAILPTGAVAMAAADAAPKAGETGGDREFYELRIYRLRRGPMAKRLDDYLKDALLPALGRAGAGPVGVFTVVIGPDNPSVYVLIPYPSAEAFATMAATLAKDAEYQKAAAPFHALPATDPPYVRVESSLLRAFPHMPKLAVPPKEPRLFELRTYRSHSGPAGMKKIEMFDVAGEIAIFKRVGLTPVFFSQALTGPDLPNLTYLLTFPDLAAREKNFNTFRNDPEWKKLSGMPEYTDAEIVTHIHNVVLSPTAYSQI